jgi:peptide/nickel transport system substrate-binding protein
MSTKQCTRRQFLRLGSVVAVGSVLAACGATPTATPVPPTATKPAAAAPTTVPAAAAPTTVPAAAAPTATKAPAAAPTTAPAASSGAFKEAPMLTDLVKSGKLPDVAQRLPTNPLVVKPLTAVGQYGGTWRMGLVGAADTENFRRTMGYEPLLRWAPDGGSYLPNVAESFVANADGSQYTVKLRKGMKWSDGQPFTTADIKFWYEDFLLNTDITAKPDPIYTAAGKTLEIAVTDETTFTFKFAGPYGFFALRMPQYDSIVLYPAHYLKQFHKKYATDIDKKVADSGMKTWVDLFTNKAFFATNPEKPTLFPWNLTVAYGSNATVLPAKRNPYYWKVDTSGNQLPYIDAAQWTQHQQVDTLTLQAMNGEIDFQYRHFGTLPNKAVFFDNQQKGGYSLITIGSAQGNSMCIYFNLSSVDPVLGPLLRNKDFRIGLSHAMNRKEIIDLIYFGQATPAQFAPSLKGIFANQQMSTQFTEFDLKKANEYLDKCGLTKKDAEGFRLRSDGKRLTLLAEIATTYTTHADAMNLVKKTWKEAGVDLTVKVEDRTIQWENKAANKHELFLWAAGGGDGIDVITNTQAYFPDRAACFQAPAWGDWYASGGTKGLEPDAAIKKMQSLYQELQKKGNWDDQVKGMKEIIQLSADYFPQIGLCYDPDVFGIVKNNMKNVPTRLVESSPMMTPGPSNPEQYFFTK